MQSYDPKKWFGMIFHSYNRTVIKKTLPSLIFMAVYTSAISYVVIDVYEMPFRSTTQVHSILGIVLGLILVFRMNSAYERWWEGRSQWGLMVNDTRNLAQKLSSAISLEDKETRKFFREMIGNFPNALKEHLRDGVKFELLEDPGGDAMEQMKKAKSVPNIILTLIYGRLQQLFADKKITGEQLIVLDTELHQYASIQGACERIKNTPIPYSYSMYIKKFIFIFVITLPFGFITTFMYFTIPIVLLLFYILVSIELIAEEIEDPFGHDVNDLPTDQLAEKIRNDVREIFSVTEK
ncbi:MAG: bestrophin family ion channel [Bacteroidota bacterium]